MQWVAVGLLGLALVVVNARGTRRIWRSRVYERGQLIAQTVLIWVVPGSVFVVLGILEGGSSRGVLGDPTARNPETSGFSDDVGGHHGGFGNGP